jgi:hypothetical protein
VRILRRGDRCCVLGGIYLHQFEVGWGALLCMGWGGDSLRDVTGTGEGFH